MAFRFVQEPYGRKMLKVLPGASTVLGFVGATDVGKMCMASSNHGLLAVGTTADTARAAGVIGIISAVPTATTPGSSVPFYVTPVLYGDVIEIDYSTTYNGTTDIALATTNIGKYYSFGASTTPAGGAYFDASIAGNAPGTTDSLMFKLVDFSTTRGVGMFTVNSSHLSL